MIILKPHPFRKNVYVTKDGQVFQECPSYKEDFGYTVITIRTGKSSRKVRRHTIIAEITHGPCPPGLVCRHIDDNPANDTPDNLVWGTQAQNMQDAVNNGTHSSGDHSAKLTFNQAQEIKRRRANGESGKELACEFGISEQRVCDIHRGRGWRKNHYLYSRWKNMRQRCNNPTNKDWSDYGGRGITIDPLWDDFKKFAEDVGHRPSPLHTLDRIEINGDYKKSNIQWATKREQRMNQRRMIRGAK